MKLLTSLITLTVISGTCCQAVAREMPVRKALPVHQSNGDAISLNLNQAIDLALRQNPAILNAKQEIKRTRGLVIQVRAQALPHISLVSSYNQQDPNLLGGGSFGSLGGNSSSENSTSLTPVTPSGSSGSGSTTGTGTGSTTGTGTGTTNGNGTTNGTPGENSNGTTNSGGSSSLSGSSGSFGVQDKSWSISIQATQLLYSGGGVGAALKIAKFTQDSSYYSLRQTIDDTVLTVKQQFLQVLLNRALITVQQESVQLLSNQLKDQKDRFSAGTVPRFNVLQAEVALANAQPTLITARNNYLIAQLQLAKTLGVRLDGVRSGRSPLNIKGKLEVVERSVNLAEGIAHAHAERPSLKVQRQSILIGAKNIDVAISGFKPTLALSGGYEVTSDRSSNSLADTVNGWFFGVQGNWNIFDGGATYGKLKQAKAQLMEAKNTYDDDVRGVDLEVEQAYTQIQVARETLQSQVKNVQQALEAVRLAKERLNAGAGTQLDVLNAQVALTTARSTQLQARYNYNVAMAQFDHATASATQFPETFRDPLVTGHPPKHPSKHPRKHARSQSKH